MRIHGSSFSAFDAIIVAISERNRYTVLWRNAGAAACPVACPHYCAVSAERNGSRRN